MEILAIIVCGALLVGGYYLLIWPLCALILSIILKKFSSRIVSSYLIFMGLCVFISLIAYRFSPAYPTYPDIPFGVFLIVAIYGYIFFAFQYVCLSIFGSPLIGQPKWIGDFVDKNLAGIQVMKLGEKFNSITFQAFFVSTTVAIFLTGIASIIVFVARIVGIDIPAPSTKW